MLFWGATKSVWLNLLFQMFGIKALESWKFLPIVRLFGISSSVCCWKIGLSFESIGSHADSFLYASVDVLKLFSSIMVDGISANKSGRPCGYISMLIELKKDAINLIFFLFHKMMLFNLIWVDTFVVVINICLFLVIFIVKKVWSFHGVQFEIFFLEDVSVFLFFVIKLIDKTDKLTPFFFVSLFVLSFLLKFDLFYFTITFDCQSFMLFCIFILSLKSFCLCSETSTSLTKGC